MCFQFLGWVFFFAGNRLECTHKQARLTACCYKSSHTKHSNHMTIVSIYQTCEPVCRHVCTGRAHLQLNTDFFFPPLQTLFEHWWQHFPAPDNSMEFNKPVRLKGAWTHTSCISICFGLNHSYWKCFNSSWSTNTKVFSCFLKPVVPVL